MPAEHVKNGEIVLNVGHDATHRLTIGNDLIQFAARFNGVSRECSIPIEAVTGIFAKENGQGLFFPREAAPESGGRAPAPEPTPPAAPPTAASPSCRSSSSASRGRRGAPNVLCSGM